jgi:hypothetical protein
VTAADQGVSPTVRISLYLIENNFNASSSQEDEPDQLHFILKQILSQIPQSQQPIRCAHDIKKTTRPNDITRNYVRGKKGPNSKGVPAVKGYAKILPYPLYANDRGSIVQCVTSGALLYWCRSLGHEVNSLFGHETS